MVSTQADFLDNNQSSLIGYKAYGSRRACKDSAGNCVHCAEERTAVVVHEVLQLAACADARELSASAAAATISTCTEAPLCRPSS